MRLAVGLAGELLVVQALVEAAGCDQLVVGSLLDDPAVLETEDDVGGLDGGEPVRDRDRGARAGGPFEGLLDEALGFAQQRLQRALELRELSQRCE